MADETAVSEKKPAKKKPAGNKPTGKKPPGKKPAAKKPSGKKPPAKKPPKKVTNGEREQLKFAVEPEIVEAPKVVVVEDADDDDDDDGDDAVAEVVHVADEDTDKHVAVELSPEEQELQALYGEDTAQPGIAHAEYKDRQTADEDRPMMPEINARDERKAQWQERRDRRRSRREDRERQRDERRDQRRGQPAPAQAQAQTPSAPRPPQQNQHNQQAYRPVQPPVQITPATDGETPSRVGTPLGDAAATVFAQLRNGQPLPVRQLAAMMRKRSLVESDPDQLAPQLKAELLGDERSYRTLGLRPRIVYRGRDLFAPDRSR